MDDLGTGSHPISGATRQPEVVERRLASRVLWTWRDLASTRARLPDRSKLVPSRFGNDWPSCFVLELGAPTSPRRLTEAVLGLLGENVLALTEGGEGLVGRPFGDIASAARETLLLAALREIDVVLDHGVPAVHGGDVEFRGCLYLYRSALLPFAGETEGVEVLLGAVNARAIALGP